jgi:drug/metabolite transporter (DMT)-like permease
MALENTRSGTLIAPLIVTIGGLVGGSFALAKHAVMAGLSPLTLFAWQMLGAGILLLAGICIRRRAGLRELLARPVVIYCIANGLIGVAGPQVLSYFALQQVPAGLFTMLITLSPLLTFLLSSLANRRLLPVHRLTGILIGLVGVTMATANGLSREPVGGLWLAAACAAPLLLAMTNVYRERAMPKRVDPIVLAAGTLISQAALFLPFVLTGPDHYLPLRAASQIDLVLVGLSITTALSYALTFELYRRTDGVGVSQVGYFVTITGAGAGTLFFGEAITLVFGVAVSLLFLGMAITNGHLGFLHRGKAVPPKGS